MRVTAAFLLLLLDSPSTLLVPTIVLVCKLLILHICHTGFFIATTLQERLAHKSCHLLTLSYLPVPKLLICMQLLKLLWLLNFAIVKSKTNHSVLHCQSTVAKIILGQRSIVKTVKTHPLLPQQIYPLLCCLCLKGKV